MPEADKDFIAKYGIDAQGVRQYASDGGTVFFIRALRDWAVAADYSDGRYAPEFTAEIDMYAADLSLFTAWPADCAWDGSGCVRSMPNAISCPGRRARINAGTPWSCRAPEARNMWVYTTGRGAARATAAPAR